MNPSLSPEARKFNKGRRVAKNFCLALPGCCLTCALPSKYYGIYFIPLEIFGYRIVIDLCRSSELFLPQTRRGVSSSLFC